eukprot:g19110.t1
MPEFCDGTALSPQSGQLTAETPLWKWRPAGSTGRPWVRFDAVASAVLEEGRRKERTDVPRMPVGELRSLNTAAMTGSLVIGHSEVPLSLERRTAGDGTKEQEAEARAAGCQDFTWERLGLH